LSIKPLFIFDFEKRKKNTMKNVHYETSPNFYHEKCPLHLIILFFFVSQLSFSQPYKPILKADSTTWHIIYTPTGFGVIHATGTLYNKQADTIINGKQYCELFDKNLFSLGSSNDHFYLAEDTLTGKAWLYFEGLSGNGERLIMDMNLNVGDTFFIHNGNGSTNYSLVDSVFYDAGLKHIRLDYTQFVQSASGFQEIPLMFIEGIGPNFSPVFNHPYAGLSNPPFFLLCKEEDTLQTFHLEINNQSGSNLCTYSYITDVYENTNLIFCEISPNPFTNNLSIENNNSYDIEYIIYNSLGQKMTMPAKINSFSSQSINMEGLHSGIYFIQIRSENTKQSSLKIIKY
jgi:hypothetical protein